MDEEKITERETEPQEIEKPAKEIPKKKKNFTPAQIEVIKQNLAKAREASFKKRAESKELTARKKMLKEAKEIVNKKEIEAQEFSLAQRVKQLEELLQAKAKSLNEVKPKPRPKRVPIIDEESCEDSEDEYTEKLKQIQKLRLERKAREKAEQVKTESAQEILRKQVESLRDNYLKSWLLS